MQSDRSLRGTASGPTLQSILGAVFRLRYWLHMLIFVAAFVISWATIQWAGAQRIWLSLPELMATRFGVDLHEGIVGVTGAAILLAVAGAFLRTWGTAYLGARVVFGAEPTAERFVLSGPYRYVRNPLYLGTVLHTLSLCVLMSWVAAGFAIVAIIALQVGLIASEESFLMRTAGPKYAEFAMRVPRIVPRVFPAQPEGRLQPLWIQAFGAEIYMWGVAISFAAFGWTYNAVLILQGVLVSFGVSVVLRGLTGKR